MPDSQLKTRLAFSLAVVLATGSTVATASAARFEPALRIVRPGPTSPASNALADLRFARLLLARDVWRSTEEQTNSAIPRLDNAIGALQGSGLRAPDSQLPNRLSRDAALHEAYGKINRALNTLRGGGLPWTAYARNRAVQETEAAANLVYAAIERLKSAEQQNSR
ncbi:MAG: hypothetical protein ACREM6_00425 [Vulcanimicrobiaceae bacterium]